MEASIGDQIKNKAKNMHSVEKACGKQIQSSESHSAGLRPEVTDVQMAGYL